MSADQIKQLKEVRLNSSALNSSALGRIEVIKASVASVYEIEPNVLFGAGRSADVVWPRHLSMWLCSEFARAHPAWIGELHGGRDRSTVLHAVRSVENRAATEPARAKEVERWKSIIPNLFPP